MDNTSEANLVRLCGHMSGPPRYSHSSRAQDFYTFPLEVQRLSGTYDRINVLIRRELLESCPAEDCSALCLTGELRSFNNRRGEGAKLIISVLARELSPCGQPDTNEVFLRGVLCKEPQLRSTPMGRDICDLMLAVNRRYGRSDYLPCICWGQNALRASLWGVGTEISLEGRLQSRKYIKLTDKGPEEKTAFEVSVYSVSQLSCSGL